MKRHGPSSGYDFSRQTKTAMERGDGTLQDQILQVDENMLETKLDRLVSRKVEELLNAMPDASGRRDHRRGQVRAYRGEEGVPGGPLRAGPDREGRHRAPEGPEAQGRAVRVGGDRPLQAS